MSTNNFYDNHSGSESEDDDFNPQPEVDEEDAKPAAHDSDDEGDHRSAPAVNHQANDEEEDDEEGGGDDDNDDDEDDEEDEDEDEDEDVVVCLPSLKRARI